MSLFIILALIFLFIFFIFIVFYLTIRFKRVMLCVCLLFVVIAFSLYTAGYLSSGSGFADALFAALRGLFSTARMFSINDDYEVLNNVQGTQWLTENVWIKILLWCCYISALIIVQTALIALFGRKLIDNFRLNFGSHKELYIIKGSDKNALLLAENIVTHDMEKKHPDKKRLIIFLLEEDDDEKKIYEKASRFGGIVRVLDRDHDFSYFLKKAKLKRRNWLNNFIKEKKYNIVLMSKDASILDDVQLIAEYAKENTLNPEKLDVFVFTLSEWDREKIEEITQAKDGNQRKYPCTFHIVNEIDLLTRQMIEKHPPFECPGLNLSGGKAARNFTVMILGFGPVGQSALLRLVMNGQFMGSRMRAIIIDKDIDNLRDCFLHRYPGLKLCCDMEFENINVQCKEFFTLLDFILQDKRNNVDYIVAALHGDEINKQTALDIKHHYERKGIKALPFIAVTEMNGNLCETKQVITVSQKDKSLHETKQDEKIFVFGSRYEVYKESVVIREQADIMAEAVNDVYGGQPWHELEWFLQESNRAAADFIPAMLKLAGCNEKDAIEKKTLTNDNSLAEILAQTEHLRWNAFHAAMGYRPIDIEEMNRRFNEYNGNGNSLDFARRDSKARLQVCLVHWDELDKISEAYRKLANHTENLKEQKRDFKMNDRHIIENIPKFLEAAGKK
ncbi:hypothetical protein R84B8_03246 [Treponema sp. R8-4-B8]